MTSRPGAKQDAKEFSTALDTDSEGPDCRLRLWIGGLPPRTTEYGVLQLIRQFGPLADFSFPVHRYGDLQGSTVGYCFVTYKDERTANLALKSLNGLNFHGHQLVTRRANPTRDELTLSQQACEEETRMRIVEETRRREAQLAAHLVAAEGIELRQADAVLGRTIPDSGLKTFSALGTLEDPELSSNYRSPVSLPSVGSTHQATATERRRPSAQATKAAAIQRIEFALHRLTSTPVGGPSLLQPCSLVQPRPLLPPGLTANRTGRALHQANSQSYKRGGGGGVRRTRDVRPVARRGRW